jgi:hypothetical protein
MKNGKEINKITHFSLHQFLSSFSFCLYHNEDLQNALFYLQFGLSLDSFNIEMLVLKSLILSKFHSLSPTTPFTPPQTHHSLNRSAALPDNILSVLSTASRFLPQHPPNHPTNLNEPIECLSEAKRICLDRIQQLRGTSAVPRLRAMLGYITLSGHRFLDKQIRKVLIEHQSADWNRWKIAMESYNRSSPVVTGSTSSPFCGPGVDCTEAVLSELKSRRCPQLGSYFDYLSLYEEADGPCLMEHFWTTAIYNNIAILAVRDRCRHVSDYYFQKLTSMMDQFGRFFPPQLRSSLSINIQKWPSEKSQI